MCTEFSTETGDKLMFVRCDRCRGQKKVRGLGCLLKKCEVCAGAGFIEREDASDEVDNAKLDDVEQVETVQDVQKIEDSPNTKETKKKSHWSKKQ